MISPRAEAGKHGWRSACHPKHIQHDLFGTFSVGIFQWVPKASGFGVKPSKVLVRVSGPGTMPGAVDARVAQIIQELDAGTYTGSKKVVIA